MSLSPFFVFSRRLTALAALSVLLGVTGCASNEAVPTGTVSGTVTFEGEPVTEGTVQFVDTDRGVFVPADLGEGGKFTIEQPLQAGTYTVVVTPPEPTEAGDPSTTKLESPPNIPRGYHSETTSDLRVEVKEGENNIPIEMKRGGPPRQPTEEMAP